MRTITSAAITALLAFTLFMVTPAQASEPINETREIAADGTVEIENVRGSIRVEASNRSDVAITGTLGEGVKGLKIVGDGQHLSIEVEYPESGGGWFSGWGGSKAESSDLRIQLPASVSVDVSSVSAHVEVVGVGGQHSEINSVSGRIEYAGTAAELEIETVSGAIEIDGSASNASVQSVSGRVSIDATVTERLVAESVSGDVIVKAQNALQRLQVSTVSGDLLLTAQAVGGARFDIESLSGDVQLNLAPGTSARLRAETFSGDLSSDVGRVEREELGPGAHLDTQLLDGNGDIRVESFSGGIRVRSK
ncbi:MAG: DUF4097 family beta strand repeat-containing protein [Pseudomarimonas sp.]